MFTSVQIVDRSPGGTLRALLRRPKPQRASGLRSADVGLCVPLAMATSPAPKRAALIAFWDDEASFDRFVAHDPIGQRFTGGFEARLRPLRAFGDWPGLDADVDRSRNVPHEGPVVVLTLGRLRISQLVRFMRTSRPAEKSATEHPGLVWGTAGARPPFVATVSIWQSSKDAATYAYGRQQQAHPDAITEQRRKDFHKQSAFIRFAPIRVTGSLAGRNPLPAEAVAAVNA